MNIVFWALIFLGIILLWLFIIFMFPIDKIVESIMNKTKEHVYEQEDVFKRVYKQKDEEDNIISRNESYRRLVNEEKEHR